MGRIINKRNFILSFLLAAVVAVGVFHHALICMGVKFYVSSRLPPGESAEMSYEKGIWKDNAFILQKVSLIRQNAESEKVFDVKIEDLRFVFSLEFFPFHFAVQTVVNAPEINLLERDFKAARKKKGLYAILERLFFKREVVINRARIGISSHQAIQASFSFVSRQGEEKRGQLQLAMTDEGLDQAPLLIDFYKQGGELGFGVHVNELDLAWLFSMARFFSIPIDPALHISQGALSGNLDFGWTRENRISQIQYDLTLSDFELRHARYDMAFSAHQIKWQEHLNRSSDPFFEKIWPYFIGNGEFCGAKIAFKDRGTIELLGKLQFSKEELPLADFHGLFIKGDREYPLTLVAEGSLESDQNWRLAVDLSLTSEEGEKMTSYLAFTSQGQKKYFFESRFDKISEDPVDLIQHLFKVRFPFLERVHIDEGVFSGKFVGWIEDRHFHRFELNDFFAENLSFTDGARELYFSANELKGDAEFDLTGSDFFDGTFWELGIEGGKLRAFNTYLVTDLAADLSMHDQYVKPSVISGCLNGIEGDIRLEGLYTHLNLNFDFGLSPNDFFLVLGQEKCKELKRGDEKLTLDVAMQLKLSDKELATDGKLEIIREKRLPSDTVAFELNWDKKTLKDKGFLKGLSSGLFSSERLSSETINLPLEFFGRSWRCEGFGAIIGKLSSERIELSLDPSELSYISPYIILENQNREERAQSCNLCYEFAKNKWSGKIPLKEAKLTECSFGLEFDSFSSEIDLQGTFFDFQNVAAASEGMHFEGQISLDYQYSDYAKLQITTSKIEGSTDAVQCFLRHFEAFKKMNIPVKGRMESGEKGMLLTAYVGEKEELLSWEVCADLREASYDVAPAFSFEDLTTRLEWSWKDQILKLTDSDGYLSLRGGEALKNYRINIPVAEADFKQDAWKYDLRLETPTHDICRLVGNAAFIPEKKEMHVFVDSNLTRFFGAKINFDPIIFNSTGQIERLSFETDLSARDLYHHLDFIVHAGILPLKITTLEEIQSPRFEGEAHLEVSFGRNAEFFTLNAKSDHFVFGTLDLDNLQIHAERKENEFKIDRFEAGSLFVTAQMVKEEEKWNIPYFDIDWKECQFKARRGFYHHELGKICLPFDHASLNLGELLKLVPTGADYDLSYLDGQIASSGLINLDLSQGLKKWGLEAKLQIAGEEFSKAKLRVESPHALHLSYFQGKGFEIGEADFHFLHPRSNQLWAKCHLGALNYKSGANEWAGNGIKVIVPPEMLHHLGATHALPYLAVDEDGLVLFDYPFMWDNQMELTFDFHKAKELDVQGRLKEGYYWIGERAWLLNDFCFHWQGGRLDLKLNTLLEENPFDVQAEVSLLPHIKTRLTIQETIPELRGGEMPLTIVSDYSENEGFFIQSIEGTLCGLDFSFHHNPRGSFLDQMVLTGQVKIDAPMLSRFLPATFQEMVKKFEIGRGYEVSGDCILSKDKLLESHFSGYLKGKRFQLMGSEMETLLSEITIHPDLVELNHFNMSDTSGIFSMNEIRFEKMPDLKWNMTIPHLSVQDFRPSLLKKIGRYRGRIKPLTIRELSFHNIRGTLGSTKSFTGQGSLYFTNTFKRDYNILDIPFEILGRLGLDMGLLVPVRGRLDYVMSDGKVFLTELSSSFSEGKRSKFYLSPSQPSYIDFDGNLNLNIKMRQYVLLKITEPFTLSIGGTFIDPRYSLR